MASITPMNDQNLTEEEIAAVHDLWAAQAQSVGLRSQARLSAGERRGDETISECMARKIPILIGEGMDQDQAVAVARRLCSE